jgi:hypothetical protein
MSFYKFINIENIPRRWPTAKVRVHIVGGTKELSTKSMKGVDRDELDS